MLAFKIELSDLNLWELKTLDQHLESLNGIDKGPLHGSDSCAAWYVCESPNSGTRMCPWCMSCLFGT